MSTYKGFDLNTPDTPRPWGSREYQALRDVVDTLVNATVEGTKTLTGHTHANSTGIQGSTGVTGSAGATGAAGTAGSQGTTGVQGRTGVQGNTGTAGITGLQGKTGAAGTTGVAGTQGATGVAGTAGSQGVTGIAGVNGVTGVAGTAGSQGATGVAGVTGVAGSAGTSGSQGVTGLKGATGVAGANGSAGSQGATGIQGTTGPAYAITGTSGKLVKWTTSNGDLGDSLITEIPPYLPDGPSISIASDATTTGHLVIGNVGIGNTTASRFLILDPFGSTNQVQYRTASQLLSDIGGAIQGPTGPAGAQGTTGVAGKTGLQGTTGVQGTQGSQGVQVNAGATGVQGIQGTQGVKGDQGNTGMQGITGLRGATGIQGNTGAQGQTGPGTFSGTTNYVTKFTGAMSGGNSSIFDNGTFIGMGVNTSLHGGVTFNSCSYVNGANNRTGAVMGGGDTRSGEADVYAMSENGAGTVVSHASLVTYGGQAAGTRYQTIARSASNIGSSFLDLYSGTDNTCAIGTTSNTSLVIGTHNIGHIEIGASGRVVIGNGYSPITTDQQVDIWPIGLNSVNDTVSLMVTATSPSSGAPAPIGSAWPNPDTGFFFVCRNTDNNYAASGYRYENQFTMDRQGNCIFGNIDYPANILVTGTVESRGNMVCDAALSGATIYGGNLTGSGNRYVYCDPTGELRPGSAYSSDARLKKDVYTLPGVCDKLSRVRGVSFNWKENNKEGIGVIAQELEKEYKLLVTKDDKGFKNVDYPTLTAVLLQAINELTKRVTELEEKI